MVTDNSFSAREAIWSDTSVLARQPEQTGQITVDVCVVGAGIAGLTAANLLKHSGKTVAVIEMSRVGAGETGHSTAHLSDVFDRNYRDLLAHFGPEVTKLAARSMRRAIEGIEKNVDRLAADCELQHLPGYKFTSDDMMIEELEEEALAATRCGVTNHLLFNIGLPCPTARAIRFDHQGQINPLKYLQALAKRIPGEGSYLFEMTRMLELEEGEPCRVTTNHGTVIAKNVFLAANAPSIDKLYTSAKISAYRTYAIAVKTPHFTISPALYWDSATPYRYLRTLKVNQEDYVIVGGEDHKTGVVERDHRPFERLEQWTKHHFVDASVTHRWSGQIIEPIDGFPMIGKKPNSDYVYLATGFSGTGITMGALSGELISDLILNRENCYAELYDPSRSMPISSIKGYLREHFHLPNFNISHWLSGHSIGTLRENSGVILRVNNRVLAAYRDPHGELHTLSPACSHRGGNVQWNDHEKSWDCPCHGSRFSPIGRLLNGPALADLTPVNLEDDSDSSSFLTAELSLVRRLPIGLASIDAY